MLSMNCRYCSGVQKPMTGSTSARLTPPAGPISCLCLSAADGSVLWDVPLKINPWAGPTVAGGLVANLSVSTTGQDADWVVKLIDEIALRGEFTGGMNTYSRPSRC